MQQFRRNGRTEERRSTVVLDDRIYIYIYMNTKIVFSL